MMPRSAPWESFCSIANAHQMIEADHWKREPIHDVINLALFYLVKKDFDRKFIEGTAKK